jgi:hypothetical protein
MVKQIKAIQYLVRLVVFLVFLTGCAALPQSNGTPVQTISPPTHTPDPCTGWDCTITGVVYEGEAGSGHEVSGAVVKLIHTSYCSPTKGEQEIVTSEDGVFEFEIFLHDTDGFRIEVELEGYQSGVSSFGGFDCLYCACQPIEIVLEVEKRNP